MYCLLSRRDWKCQRRDPWGKWGWVNIWIVFVTFSQICFSPFGIFTFEQTFTKQQTAWKPLQSQKISYSDLTWELTLSSLEIIHLLSANYAKVKFNCNFRQMSVFLRVLKLNLSKYFPEKQDFSLIRLFTWLLYSYIACTNNFFHYKNKEKHCIHPLFVENKKQTQLCISTGYILFFPQDYLFANFWAIYNATYSQHRITISKSW